MFRGCKGMELFGRAIQSFNRSMSAKIGELGRV